MLRKLIDTIKKPAPPVSLNKDELCECGHSKYMHRHHTDSYPYRSYLLDCDTTVPLKTKKGTKKCPCKQYVFDHSFGMALINKK